MTIWKFEYTHCFLSNHYPMTLEMNGYTFGSAWAAYLSLVYPDKVDEFVRMNGIEALQYEQHQLAEAGKTGNHKPQYAMDPVVAMEKVLRIKFSKPALKKQLIATAPQKIVNVTYNDTFWGRAPDNKLCDRSDICPLKGEDHLGKLLMKLRREYLKEAA